MNPKRRSVPGIRACRGFRIMAKGTLAAARSPITINFVAQDACQPGPRRGLAGKGATCFNCREESLLNDVLGHTRVAHLANGEVEKVIGMGFHPIATKSRGAFTVGCQFWCGH